MARPREFDQSKVMLQITRLFWEKGFLGTSMDDLVKATGLKKGSLYACFGNKEKIFEMALLDYSDKGPFHARKKETAMETLRSFYEFLIGEADLPRNQRRGCLVFNSCLEFGNKVGSLTPRVMAVAEKVEGFFHSLIREAQKNGEIPIDLDTRKAAQRAFAAAFTLREMTKFKTDKDFLAEIANTALASLETKQRVILKRKAS
jgi:TetR/AcrR family transcriptional repressor of nem operon